MKKKILGYACILVSVGCNTGFDRKFIVSKTWEFDSGIRIGNGDFIKFDFNIVRLKNDTIIKWGRPVGKIIELNDGKNELYIRSLTSDSVGLYINTEEFEH